MKIGKKVISNLVKCYAIAPLFYRGQKHFLVASEKDERCLLFDLEGNEVDTIWTTPGGVMCMVQVPGSDGQFLSTYQFYSPDDSKEARIVIVTPTNKGNWEVRTLVALPHIHRFDILQKNGVNYLVACTVKSGHDYAGDWSNPGKVYVAELPNDLSTFNQNHQLKLVVLKDQLFRNHGYYRIEKKGNATSLISADNGVFQLSPPERKGEAWDVEKLLNTPASDAVLVDMDGDGEEELAVLSPFHGNQICFYKKQEGQFVKVYEYKKQTDFLHAIYGGNIGGKPIVIIGHREGEKSLIAFSYNPESGTYQTQILDTGCGPANVYKYTREGKEVLIASNREVDEVAMYFLEA